MTDEVETPDLEDEDYAYDGSGDSEYVEVDGAQIIAPKGWGEFADFFGAVAVRVRMDKGGTIEVLARSDESGTWQWKDPTKPDRPGTVAAIKPDKATK